MMTNKLFKSLVSLIVIALLSVSLVTVGVFAEEEAVDGVLLSAPAESNADETAEAPAEDAPADDTAAEDKSEAESDETEEVPTTGEKEEEEEGLGLGFWISFGIFGVLILVGVALAIKNRDKVKAWWRSYKSELKKIVWYPWNDVRKGTIVVVVVVVGLAAIIGLLDFAFFQGITKLGKII